MIVLSHRGPYRFEPRGDGSFSTHRSAGGVGSALRAGLDQEKEAATWIAAAFSDDDRDAARSGVLEDCGVDLRLVSIEADAHALHYDVISNGVLWFLFHGLFDRTRRPTFDRRFREAWEGYVAVNTAFAQATAEAAATLAQALDVVRGRPFDMATGYEWAFTELHVAHAERVVVDVAHDLVALTLTLGDWRRALWATDVGLGACPASELLYQDRMQACAAAADRRGIESALRDLRRTLAAADSADVPSRDTVELYEQLNARLLSGTPTEPTHGTGRGVARR